MDILFIIIGVAVVLHGADNLTEGAVNIARRFNMTELVIGLTVVAFGTSMPEMCVSLASAINGTADMAVGNVVGSNIFNIFLIVGVCAMIHPMSVGMAAIRRDLPYAFIATLMLIFFLVDGTLTKGEALIMLALFLLYMYHTLRNAKQDDADSKPNASETTVKTQPSRHGTIVTAVLKIYRFPAFRIILGLAELIIGSDVFVGHAVSLATTLGVHRLMPVQHTHDSRCHGCRHTAVATRHHNNRPRLPVCRSTAAVVLLIHEEHYGAMGGMCPDCILRRVYVSPARIM